MTKKTAHALIIVAVVAVAGYLAYRWYRNRQANGASGMNESGLGSNLNSVAPELVGGSAGPTAGPAVSMPLNITLQETAPPPDDDDDDDDMRGGHRSTMPIHRQRHHAAMGGGTGGPEPIAGMPDVTGGDEPEPGADVPAGATSATGQTGGGMQYV